jgi:uncharacterized protein (DUF2384 family)
MEVYGMSVEPVSSGQSIDKNTVAVGLKAVFNILSKWSCSTEEEQAALGMKRSQLFKAKKNPNSVSLSSDQVERISYLLNIHQALRIVFTNPENVYGFMKMPNHSPFFNGRTPIAVISKKGFGGLYETYRRIDSLRAGGW